MVPLLIFHDERDARVSFREGRAIVESWPCAQLVATRGLGHHRILRNPAVVRRAVAFLRRATGLRSGPRALARQERRSLVAAVPVAALP